MSKLKKILPRLIRLRDAADYLGMSKTHFKQEVREYVTDISIGKQGIAFDRLDLDAWAEHYIQRKCSRRPAAQQQRSEPWDVKKRLDFSNAGSTGISTNKSSAVAFEKAVALSRLKKQSAI